MPADRPRRQLPCPFSAVSDTCTSLTGRRYRLAPQTRWPGQLVDSLLAYLYLLHPPPDAPHQPISPSKIIFSGDSAGVLDLAVHTDIWGELAMSMLMAIQSAHVDSVPLPAGIITLSGLLDSSFCFGMDGPQSAWDPTVSPHDSYPVYKPSPALPKLTVETAHPYLPRMDVAMHPLASPILCPDEMFKTLPPMLMLASDGEFVYKEFCTAPRLYSDGSVLCSKSAFERCHGAIL